MADAPEAALAPASSSLEAARARLLTANMVMRYDYAWKDAEFQAAESRLVGLGCRFLYLHATWVHAYTSRHPSASLRTSVFICDNGYEAFSTGLARACERMGYSLAADAADAGLVLLYVAPPGELRCGDRSQLELLESVREQATAAGRSVDEQPIVCALLGDATFLESPATDEAERLRGLSDFAISQQLRPLASRAGYEAVAQFAVEFLPLPPSTTGQSDETKMQQREQLSELMTRFGSLDKNLMRHAEKWELLAPAGSAFCHAQDDAQGVTQVGEEEAAFWATTARRHACDQCLRFAAKLSQCARCHEAVYCSRECQKAAWKLHKLVCGQPS